MATSIQPAIHPRSKPSGQDVPAMGSSWEETTRLKDATLKSDVSAKEVVEFSEHESEKKKFHPLLFQAHGIIIGISLMTLFIFLIGWWTFPLR